MNDDAIHVELAPFFLNQSRWKLYQDCDRLYGWFHIEGIEPERPRTPLVMGSAVHKAQVAIQLEGGTDDAIIKATNSAAEFFRTEMTPKGPRLPQDEAEINEGVETIKRLIPAYYTHWKELGQVWKPLGMELAFCVEVGEGTNVFLVGTIDNLVSFSNGLWLVDYKTMGKFDMREFLKYEIDIQLTAYIYGGTKKLSLDARAQGKPPVVIRGAIIDGIIKTKEPQFHREIYTRTIDDLREFETEFCMKAWEIASKHAVVNGNRELYNVYRDKMYDLGEKNWKVAFPKNTQQCFRYGTCSHRDLCVKDNETRRLSYKKRENDYVDKAAEEAQKRS